MGLRLHRHGRFRAWLGRRVGGDVADGDRLWRRIMHALGALSLLFYAFPSDFFVVVTTREILLLALAAALAMELLRHAFGLELPTVRPFEADRLASFAFFAIALVVAIWFFPEPIAVAVILGSALVDPLIGELRRSGRARAAYPIVPLAVYAAMAFIAFVRLSPWGLLESSVLALVAACIAIAVERPKLRWSDDDLAMTLVPALALVLGAFVWPS